MPTDTQSPAFDAVAEYRKNYDDPRSDEDIAIKLKDPTNFRKAFPDFDYSAPDANQKIAQHMSQYYSQKFAAPRNAQKTDFEKHNEQPEGFLARGLKGLTTKLPGNYSEVPEGAGLTGISTDAGEVADAAKNRARQTEVAQLKDTAQGVEPSTGSKLKHLGLNTVGSTAQMISGATSPSSQAIGAGMAVLPEVVGPALVAHGVGTAAAHAPGAIQGNPEEAEASLGGLSEAAGGGAATLHGFTGGGGIQRIGKVTAPARIALAQKSVSPLVYENLGETGADTRMNINPERGLTKEGIVGGSKESLFKQAEERTAELKKSANNILQNHQNARIQIDAEPLIDQAIDSAIKSTEKVAGNTERLENLRTALKTRYGAIKGTPFEMNNLKSEIQEAARGVGAYKNTQPVEASVASAMGDVANRIRGEVNKHVPEAANLNQRMADLIDAQAGLRKNINADRGRSSFGGFHEGMATRIANNTLGSAPVRSGLARILMAGETEGVPKPMTLQRAVPKGLLGQGATEMGMGVDTSGPVPTSERQPPMIWTPEMRARVAREMPHAPPRVRGEVTSIGSVQNPSVIGARGQAGVRTIPESIRSSASGTRKSGKDSGGAAMKLTTRQGYSLLDSHGSYITEVCDTCGTGIGPVRFTRRDDPGVWCSRECRDGKEAHQPGTCHHCGATLEGKKRGAKWCNESCRKRLPVSVEDTQNNPESAAHSKGLNGAKKAVGYPFPKRADFVDSGASAERVSHGC